MLGRPQLPFCLSPRPPPLGAGEGQGQGLLLGRWGRGGGALCCPAASLGAQEEKETLGVPVRGPSIPADPGEQGEELTSYKPWPGRGSPPDTSPSVA